MIDPMHRDVKALIESRQHCVMATVNGRRPYCSLMAYVAEFDVTAIYMVSHRHTQKFSNLIENPAVSLLIDTRETSRPQALTVEGTFSEVSAAKEKAHIRDLFLARHPHMQAFVDHEDAAFIRIGIDSALYLDGLTDARYVAFPRKTE